MDSILTSIKKMLGIIAEYEHFDTDLIIHINSVFSILYQLGVGPKEDGKVVPYMITDDKNTWDEFIQDKTTIEMVKSYMYLKCRLIFDPPATNNVLEAINRQIAEFESRLNYAVDPEDTFDESED